MDQKAMYKLGYGLYVLTAKEEGFDNGCIINTAMQVTTTPNRISVTVNKANKTHDMILNTKEFTISVLAENADFQTFQHFGFQSGANVNKFENYTTAERGENGIYYVTAGTNAYISGKVVSTVDLGTHTMFIADVTGGEVLAETTSATYDYYQKNIKPQPQAQKKTGYVCTICGYVYEGDQLPEDFICPLCKHGASDFVKL